MKPRHIQLLLFIIILTCLLTSCCRHKSSGGADCTNPEICVKCGEVLTPAAGHTPGGAATCEEPCVCLTCGSILEQAKGHTPSAAGDCTTAVVCTVCGKTLSEAPGHTPGPAADCTNAQLCLVCGITLAEKNGHTESAKATCDTACTCISCGKILTEALGHEASGSMSCTSPVKCTRCGLVLSPAPGHMYGAEADCTNPQVCTVCGAELAPALGHQPGPEATTASSQYCLRCGAVLAYPVVDETFIEETENTGHYINSVKAYYSGNVLVCGNYAMEYFGASATGNTKYANTVKSFAESYPSLRVCCMIVPKSATFNIPAGYADMYEKHSTFISATYALMGDSVITADAIGLMAEHRGEYMFYRTDHHWTSLGAYYASVAFCRAMDIAPRELSSYRRIINSGFMGTLYGYCNTPKPVTLARDYTVGHLPESAYTLTYRRSGKTYTGTAINEKSATYAGMFICGDQPFTDILTENKTGRRLIVFKESYGNAFVPYMIDYYDEIVVIDIREDTDSVKSIIEQYGITDALIINNMQAVSSLQSTLDKKLKS